jgi:hypothetical protein
MIKKKITKIFHRKKYHINGVQIDASASIEREVYLNLP